MAIGLALVEYCRRVPYRYPPIGLPNLNPDRAEDVSEQNQINFDFGQVEIVPMGSGYYVSMKPAPDQPPPPPPAAVGTTK